MQTANIHTPQRLLGESQKAYRKRRITSRSLVELMTLTGRHSQHGLKNSRTELRDAMRKSGAMKKRAGAYGRGLRNQFANKPSKGRI